MRRIICGIILGILIGGCYQPVPNVVIDESALEEIPKEMALEYLKEMGEKYPAKTKCELNEEDVSFKWGKDSTLTWSEDYRVNYDKAYFEVFVHGHDGSQMLSLEIRLKKDSFFGVFCTIADVNRAFKTKDDPEIQRIANKVATALKSLGVDIEKNKGYSF